LIGKILIVVAVLVIANDFPNMRATLIDVFREGEKTRQDISELLRDSLNRLDEELRPDVIALEPPGVTGVAFRIVTGGGAGSLDAALAKSSDVEVSGHLKIPMSYFADLLRQPVRRLLRVEVVNGALQTGTPNTLLAFSSSGESWRIPIQSEGLAGGVEELELSLEVVDERERRRTLLGKLSSQTPRPRWQPGERYATYVEAYHRDDGSDG
jgi:hypothetical protein